MPIKRVSCKFFMNGNCLKGEYCEFSHDLQNNICRFYQEGACNFGSLCRFNHVKYPFIQDTGPLLSNFQASANKYPNDGNLFRNDVGAGCSDYASRTLANIPICVSATFGNCNLGARCPYFHGHLCPTCGKNCLHPYRQKERDEHIQQCQSNRRYSQDIECSVCLEKVLSKREDSERKFGLLSECEHTFCFACIQDWRSKATTGGNQTDITKLLCPVCRKLSQFVIPSLTWHSRSEEKRRIVDYYKENLSSIDCKLFNFGNGTCPFERNCFYKHARRDGEGGDGNVNC